MRFVGDIALDAEVRAIASGAITDGAPVIVNTDGTVTQVTGSSFSSAVGSEVTVNKAVAGFAVMVATLTILGADRLYLLLAKYHCHGNSLTCRCFSIQLCLYVTCYTVQVIIFCISNTSIV